MGFPFFLSLCTGTGSQMIIYDVLAGKTLNSFHVFEGIRVHGISCSFVDSTNCRSSATLAFKIAIFGERRIKLFSLHFDTTLDYQILENTCFQLTLILALPKFSHWVMDVCFLKVKIGHCCHYLSCLLLDSFLLEWCNISHIFLFGCFLSGGGSLVGGPRALWPRLWQSSSSGTQQQFALSLGCF